MPERIDVARVTAWTTETPCRGRGRGRGEKTRLASWCGREIERGGAVSHPRSQRERRCSCELGVVAPARKAEIFEADSQHRRDPVDGGVCGGRPARVPCFVVADSLGRRGASGGIFLSAWAGSHRRRIPWSDLVHDDVVVAVRVCILHAARLFENHGEAVPRYNMAEDFWLAGHRHPPACSWAETRVALGESVRVVARKHPLVVPRRDCGDGIFCPTCVVEAAAVNHSMGRVAKEHSTRQSRRNASAVTVAEP